MSLIGKLVYNLYYLPRSRKATIEKYGGISNYNSILVAEEKMKTYASTKLSINSPFHKNGIFEINYITGKKHIHQTLLSVFSFFKHLNASEARNFRINFFDDGSIDHELRSKLERKFPNINLISYYDGLVKFNKLYNKNHYPYLHKKVKELPFFLKLFFIHPGNEGLHVYIDSDTLFLSKPAAFLKWLNENYLDKETAFAIKDITQNYGYSDEVIKKVYNGYVPECLNAGFYAIHSETVDFNLIEALIRKLETGPGSSYYMEQFITAVLLGQYQKLFVAPQTEYIVFPSKEQIEHQSGVFHHYVDVSKEGYFKESWLKQISE